ncbi:MAG: LCP family protein [Patescibacteria group bacterium]|jgi:LCP family protein required for cell wall assembly
MIIAGIVLVGAVFLLANVIIPGARLSKTFGSSGLLQQLTHLTFSGSRSLVGEQDNRINILLLGVGGAGHDGAYLTDTTILASIEPSTSRVSLISLPRDLVIPYSDGSWRKLNEIYVTGQNTNSHDPGTTAANTVGAFLNIDIPYYVLVDFNGFEKMIDAVGGVNVSIDRTFTDPSFPTPGGEDAPNYKDREMSVTFTAGWQHLNGQRALMFARSRHGNNGEGSDFARARRQQKILLALKDRVFNFGVLLNPITINQLANELSVHLKTNLEPWQALHLYELAKDVNTEQVIRATVDDSPNSLLVGEINTDGAYVLRPKGGNFNRIQELARDIFHNGELIQEPTRVEILNGTKVSGLATETANLLVARGYNVVHTGNADDQTVLKTTIYDYTSGARPTSLAALRVLLNAEVAATVPDWLIPTVSTVDPNATSFTAPPLSSKADFVIIIGKDRSGSSQTVTTP